MQARDAALAAAVHDAKNMLLEMTVRLDGLATKHNCSELRELSQWSRTVQEYLVQLLTLSSDATAAIESLPPADVLGDLQALAEPLVREGIELSIDDATRELYWDLDRWLTVQALLNAIQNSLRYAASQVRVVATRQGPWLVLSVDDDGPGWRDTVDGTGLGLLFIENAAELMAGELRREVSALGGARLELRVPQRGGLSVGACNGRAA